MVCAGGAALQDLWGCAGRRGKGDADAMLALPAMQAWVADAEAERIEKLELYQ